MGLRSHASIAKGIEGAQLGEGDFDRRSGSWVPNRLFANQPIPVRNLVDVRAGAIIKLRTVDFACPECDCSTPHSHNTYQGSAVAPDSSWNVIEIGDFNGSSDEGIVWQQSTTGLVVEWQMNGSQIVSSQSIISQGIPVEPGST